MSDEKQFWQQIHAALLKQARDLQEQRAAVLQQAAAIEQRFGFRRNAAEKLEHTETANYSFIVEVTKEK